MTLKTLLDELKKLYSNPRDKGTSFEKLIKNYLLIEPKYSMYIQKVWLWSEFPYRGNMGDTGIDLVARTYDGEFWAIQCKFYDESYSISKSDVDTFLSTSSKFFNINGTKISYTYRLIVSTTDKYSSNAEDVLKDQNPPVGRIGIVDLLESNIDWKQFSVNKKLVLKDKFELKSHQKEAVKSIISGFKKNDRGKVIMACGTGKTFTSLRAVEELVRGKGNVLFLVPSIALISQTLSEWTAQCRYTYRALVVCSDNKASKGDNAVDLGIPSTTDINRLCKWAEEAKKDYKEIHFIFSTYQSIECVSEFQEKTNFKFDIMICDEAHRTTGAKLNNCDESYFIKVHDNNFIKSEKRLYMTATPRIYDDKVKNKAKNVDAELCSMDDESIYGPVFYNLTFSDAVAQNLLTDYKVLVLAVDEEYVKENLKNFPYNQSYELKIADPVKIMGCWNGLSKKVIEGDDSFVGDSVPMKRAVAFCNRIEDSKAFVELFKKIQEHININNPKESEKLINIEIDHVDGSLNALQKKEKINWLKDGSEDDTCRILSNVRCLSEGVDVPALDAVIFLNPRSSMVDIIQSVGRVMRKSPGKKYGYIMLPIGIPVGENPNDALDNNEKYHIVWSVLQALRAHDDRFNNIINKIELNKRKPNQIKVPGIGKEKQEECDEKSKSKDSIQLEFNLNTLEEWRDSIYAKMVKKVGSKGYWELWAKDVTKIAQEHIKEINDLLDNHDFKIDSTFNDFVQGLKQNINDSITKEDAIEMLAQHMITKPIFDALFEDYEFVKNNPVSQAMQSMVDILDKQSNEENKTIILKFYDSVRDRASGVDNIEGKQRIMLELYEKFFKIALPKEVKKLGIVFTPVECVDFIIKSVEVLLNKEFNKSLSDDGVHIIDGFTGTGTFIFRLLQSGIISKDKMLYKYKNEIHANEIVLLAYYIATINIEEAYHDIMKSKKYVSFEGIVLTDTFQLYEDSKEYKYIQQILPQNNKRAKRQKDLPITVCIGNPPYCVGQKSANDNSQNLHYNKLDKNITDTYAKFSKATLKSGLHDQYIRAFRWASDRIKSKGIIAFITNGAYIDNRGMDGFRKCLLDEFTSIYIFNLRGNQRTSGEESKKEGGKIFGSGSRTSVAITFLVKNPEKPKDRYINYCDIGDYLSRDEKLNILKYRRYINNIEWNKVYPDENNDWINKRNQSFKYLMPLAPIKKKNIKEKSVFTNYIQGLITSRDSWVYNFNKMHLLDNMEKMIGFYNDEVNRNLNKKEKEFILDKEKISWSRALENRAKRGEKIKFNVKSIEEVNYRPFCKQYLYYDNDVLENSARMKEMFKEESKIICMCGKKELSVLMVNNYADYHYIGDTQCFPLYWYSLDKANNIECKHDGISDYILEYCRKKYNDYSIKKEDIFYYVYGMLHSEDYKNKFSVDLKKELPRIIFVEDIITFNKIKDIGLKLSNLHLNYEKMEPYDKVSIYGYKENYAITKMKFGSINKKKDKTTIIFNNDITISNIPLKAYEYRVNGKSAIEWVMERYQVSIDKDSNIKNNPNDWGQEFGDSKYIFNLLLRIINVSIQTVELVNSLPKLNFE